MVTAQTGYKYRPQLEEREIRRRWFYPTAQERIDGANTAARIQSDHGISEQALRRLVGPLTVKGAKCDALRRWK